MTASPSYPTGTIEVAVGVHHRGGSSGCPASPVPDPAAVCQVSRSSVQKSIN